MQKGQPQEEGEPKRQIFQASLHVPLFHLVTEIMTCEDLLNVDLVLNAADTASNKTDSTSPPEVLVGMLRLHHKTNSN